MLRSERGQSLVELALVLPLLILLLAGMVDFGRAFSNYIVITNAAREGARMAARLPCYPDNPTQRAAIALDIVAATRNAVAGSQVPPDEMDIVITPDLAISCPGKGNPFRVTVSYTFSPLMGGILGIADLTVSNFAAMQAYGID